MHLDVIDLKDFYARPLGLVVRSLLSSRIRARWSDVKGARVFGLGFTTPYLASFRGEASVLGALMPAELGAVPWPEQGQSVSALVEETDLPLDDESADRVLLVHMLEWSEKSRALLREIWRVLAPNGRLLLVVPNRRGLWARVDTTPFGYGSPFSRSQLTKLLKEALFSPEEWGYALYMPPFNWAVLLRWPLFWEKLGLVLWPAFSGVILVEAIKQVYAAVPARATERKVKRRIVPVPAGVTPTTTLNSTRHARTYPGIHAGCLQQDEAPVGWIAGSSPAMTGRSYRKSRKTACSPNRFWAKSGMATPSFLP